MPKKMFIKKIVFFKKILSVPVSKDLNQRIKAIEIRAEDLELSFRLSQHLSESIEDLVTMAEQQLTEIESPTVKKDSKYIFEKSPTATQ